MHRKREQNKQKKRIKFSTHVCIFDTAAASHFPSQGIYNHSLHSLWNEKKDVIKFQPKRKYKL